MSFFDEIGGKSVLQKVHKLFYDRLFNHPKLHKFFLNTPRDHQEDQQTDFMMRLMGGPNHYYGKDPHLAHGHLFITEPIFEARHQILRETLKDCGISQEHQERWLKIDYAFKPQVVKKSISECVPRYFDEGIISIDFP